jgi:hypothetical protein
MSFKIKGVYANYCIGMEDEDVMGQRDKIPDIGKIERTQAKNLTNTKIYQKDDDSM